MRITDLVISMGCLAAVMAPHFMALSLVGRTKTARSSSCCGSCFRRPNHEAGFYPTTVPPAIGPLVIVAALAGLWLLRRQAGWRETLLLAWVLVPTVFFQLWPVKGFQYLLPAAPAMAVLAARALMRPIPAAAAGAPVRWRKLGFLQSMAGMVRSPIAPHRCRVWAARFARRGGWRCARWQRPWCLARWCGRAGRRLTL